MHGFSTIEVIQIILVFSVALPCTALAFAGKARRQRILKDSVTGS